jgi:hypothetical protein
MKFFGLADKIPPPLFEAATKSFRTLAVPRGSDPNEETFELPEVFATGVNL